MKYEAPRKVAVPVPLAANWTLMVPLEAPIVRMMSSYQTKNWEPVADPPTCGVPRPRRMVFIVLVWLSVVAELGDRMLRCMLARPELSAHAILMAVVLVEAS